MINTPNLHKKYNHKYKIGQLGTSSTMDFHKAQCDVKHEKDIIVPIQIKIEPQDVKNEIKTEAEEYVNSPVGDLQHDIKPILHCVAAIKTLSEVGIRCGQWISIVSG